MKAIIVIVLVLGAGWALLDPGSYNIVAAIALIGLGAAVITRGRYG